MAALVRLGADTAQFSGLSKEEIRQKMREEAVKRATRWYHAIYRMRSIGFLSYGYDVPVKSWVVNYTHHWFSFGATTSPAPKNSKAFNFGFTLGWDVHKRVGANQEGKPLYQAYRGFIAQIVLVLFKVYVYFYRDGDGREADPAKAHTA